MCSLDLKNQSSFLDKKIFFLGIVQALFEGSMYIFVLELTPALTQALNQDNVDKTDNKNPPIPHGSDPLVRAFFIILIHLF